MTSSKYEMLRNEELLMDFSVRVDDRLFKAHKLVLAANSDYFKGMFRNQVIESKTNEVKLEEVDDETVAKILDFCYTDKIDLTSGNVGDVLRHACRLQMSGLIGVCRSFLVNNVTNSNCLDILSQAVHETLNDLVDIPLKHCCAHFGKIIEREEFLMLDHEVLKLIIADDRLKVDDEAKVLDAVMKWASVDLPKRRLYLVNLATEIRFAIGPSSSSSLLEV